ncbi:MAG: MSCRAMM family protein [Planctomycetota bacterium]|jgi:hypothetical protein
MRSVLLLLGVGVLAVALLIGFDVIPFGAGDLPRTEDAGEGADLRDENAGEGAEGRLEGRGDPARAGDAGEGAPDDVTLDTGPSWEVRGGTPGGATLTGRVVREEGRIPVEGARVSLSRPDILFHYLRADPQGRFDELLAVTRADGRFAFRDVTPAKGYAVRARVETEPVVSVEGIDLRGRPSRDLGDLLIGPRATIVGQVVDGEGVPVPDARVVATWWLLSPLQIVLADPDTVKEIEVEGRTDAEGVFRLEGLEPTRKTLIVDGGPKGNNIVWRVDAEAGVETDVGEVVLAGTLALAGRLEWEDGGPIAGARVFAGIQNQRMVNAVETAADGTWRIEALKEGFYTLGVLVPGLPVHLEDGLEAGRTDIVVSLPVTGRIRGRVTRKTDGRPVAQFGVLIVPEGGDDFRMQMVRNVVDTALGARPFRDEYGRFELPRVPPGTVRVKVLADGHPPTSSDAVTVVSGQAVEVRIALPEGHGLQGRVQNRQGDPVSGAQIYVMPQAARQSGASPTELAQWAEDQDSAAVSDPEGMFELPPQTPGTYHLVATHLDHQATIVKHIDLGAAEPPDVEISMRPAGGIEGTVVDDRGRPASEVDVALLYADGTLLVVETEVDGRFEHRPLAPGACLVFWYSLPLTGQVQAVTQAEEEGARRAAYDALRSLTEEYEVTERDRLQVAIRLPRRTTVKGILRIDGSPADPELGVWVVPTVGWRGKFERCDGDGHFEFQLAPGAYVFWAPNGEGDWTNTPITVPETAEFQLELDR